MLTEVTVLESTPSVVTFSASTLEVDWVVWMWPIEDNCVFNVPSIETG
jgi:hypothetical protein